MLYELYLRSFACWVFFYAFAVVFQELFYNGVSNCLDPDQDQQSVGPDLGPNCLQCLSSDAKVASKAKSLSFNFNGFLDIFCCMCENMEIHASKILDTCALKFNSFLASSDFCECNGS